MNALITSIQRFCLHDGPGVRTTVFFQGCPLRCSWCANPETQSTSPVLLHHRLQCIGCGECLSACPRSALSASKEGISVDRSLCTACGHCAAVCPAGAMVLSGRSISADELLEELLRDERYFRHSGGGVTFSGGEPALQAEFLRSLLPMLREKGIHTALETCGCAEEASFAELVRRCDLLLFDLKTLDPTDHRKACGADNALILRNLAFAAAHAAVVLRTPLIPGFNDTPAQLLPIARLAKELHLLRWELMPFHRLGAQKYVDLDRFYDYADIPPLPSAEAACLARQLSEDTGLVVSVG